MNTKKKTWAAVVLLLGLSGCQGGQDTEGRPTPASARFDGPVGAAGLYGHPMWDHWFDIGEVGYVEEEFFVAGRAREHAGDGEADYVTRVIVRRPRQAADFNGTLLLDWVNVTAQFENAVDTLAAHRFFLREGYAYVHLSAQAAGLCCSPLTPTVWDPVRYAALNHPGDTYAFDMVSQIARGFRAPVGTDPMGGLRPEVILIMGQSQSAIRLHQYVNEVQARARAIDGFLIHADVGAGKDFGTAPPAPVLHLLSDLEAEPEAPTATSNYVLWEVAGAAHQDLWVGEHQVLGQSRRVVAHLPKQPMAEDDRLHAIAGNYGEQPDPALGLCVVAGAAFPMRYAVASAIDHLDRWVRDGVLPPQPPRYQFDEDGNRAVDDLGNTLGGLRYPPIDVPVARYQSTTCELGGITIPLTELELLQRYPSHGDYLAQMQTATEASVTAGYLLPEDAAELMERAAAARNRWPLDALTGN
ncbi:alpha/beta hydrolase domain-containing protein [Algiphilus sp.]|uniref:alpha/beta hydrolase domain-containing protein n=1 Tax=Algiphilus sp. TaxID=1872431 RepID=UPI003B51E0D3